MTAGARWGALEPLSACWHYGPPPGGLTPAWGLHDSSECSNFSTLYLKVIILL